MSSLVLLGYVLLLMPLIAIKPYVGVLVYSWLSYMSPHTMVFGPASNFRFAFWVALVTTAAWFISREPKRVPAGMIPILILAFGTWITITTQLYPSPAADRIWDEAIKVLAFNGILTLILLNNRERLHAFVWIIVLSVGFFGIKGGVFTLLTGGESRVWGPGGRIGDNNQLALALTMVLPLMRYLQQNSEVRFVRWFLGVFIGLTIAAILGTHSRGGLLGLSAVALVLLIKSDKRATLGFSLGALLCIGFLFMPDNWSDRMGTLLDWKTDPSALSRVNSWKFALGVVNESPIFGGGFGVWGQNVDPLSGKIFNAHSIYFEILGSHGYVGLLLYLGIFSVAYRLATLTRRLAKPDPERRWAADLANMIQVSLVGFFVAGAFLNLAFFDLVFHLVVLSSALYYVVQKEHRTIQVSEGALFSGRLGDN